MASAPSRPVEPRSAAAARVDKEAAHGPVAEVDSILIDQERRLAIIDGAIVTIGDAVGPRVVEQIDRDGVVLREPSGLSVRVGLRAKTSL